MSTLEASKTDVPASPNAEPQPGDFADKLANYFYADKGYERYVPPEAAALQDAADVVLSVNTGQGLSFVCIVDAEADPKKIFGLTADQARDIAQRCFKYTQKPRGTSHFPVRISVIEIRQDPIYERSHKLDSFRRKGLFDKRILEACVICPSSGLHISTNKRIDDFVVSVLGRPTLTISEIQSYTRPLEIPTGQPILTYGLLVGLALIFGCELLLNLDGFPSNGTPSVQTLTALGGNMGSLTWGQDQWYRLWTAMVLHASLSHLVLNGIALFIAGRILEPILGPLKLFALFMIGGLFGSVASNLWNPPNLVGVGASGAIMACFAGAIVVAFHYPAGRFQTRLIRSSLSILIPSLLPFIGAHSGTPVDYADHVGGVIGGAVIGGYFWVVWPKTQMRPSGRNVAIAGAFVGIAGLVVGAVLLAISYPERTQIAKALRQLAPQTEVQSLWKNAIAGGDTMIRQYPLDPRGHVGRAIFLLDAGHAPDAEAEIEFALEQKFAVEKVLTPDVRLNALALLALAQNRQGRQVEAFATASPLCGEKASIVSLLVRDGLCSSSK